MFDTRHILTMESGPLSKVLAKQFQVTTERVSALLEMGSIYVGQARQVHDETYPSGTHVRAHLNPKRFPVAAVDWSSTVLFQNEDFVIVDKPARIPVPPTVDNLFENVATQVSRALKISLHVTQRLDVPTTGLLLLAKTKTYQGAFNRLLQDSNACHKRYLARVPHRLTTGELTHHMVRSPKAPKIIRDEPGTDTRVCRLDIETSLSTDSGRYAVIRLLTGRTHQIRAQLSAIGAPITGDSTYGSHLPKESFFLRCFELRFRCPVRGETYRFSAPLPIDIGETTGTLKLSEES